MRLESATVCGLWQEKAPCRAFGGQRQAPARMANYRLCCSRLAFRSKSVVQLMVQAPVIFFAHPTRTGAHFLTATLDRSRSLCTCMADQTSTTAPTFCKTGPQRFIIHRIGIYDFFRLNLNCTIKYRFLANFAIFLAQKEQFANMQP